MPTITVKKHDLMRLAGLPNDYPLATLESRLELVKAELDDKLAEKDERGNAKSLRDAEGRWLENAENYPLRVELTDTNRPDLWCAEGVARQLRDHDRGSRGDYSFYTRESSDKTIVVDPKLERIRPFVGGFLADGGTIDEDGLLAFIEVQETLTRNFGKKRSTVSIGIYDGETLVFPIQYKAVGRDSLRFEPLAPAGEGAEGWESREMTPGEILEQHPTGREYASILEGLDEVPMLTDAEGKVLSFPPIINSASLGRVTPGMSKLFIEITGTVHDHCLLALNILAANLHDRGWTIHPVSAKYPYDTEHGREVTVPRAMPIEQVVPVSEFERLLGETFDRDEIVAKLDAYGVVAKAEGEDIIATIPSYRQDYLHPVDVIEDFAISRGYDAFEPCLPGDFTIGHLHPLTTFEDRVRDALIGFGLEEAICNILTNEDAIRGHMEVSAGPDVTAPNPFHGGRPVTISNVMNLNYSRLRDWILPSLMETESHSAGASYPHRVFEVGEVAVHDPSQNMGSRTESRLGLLIADETASFDDVQSQLYALMATLGVEFRVEAWDHPSFIAGRAAKVLVKQGEADIWLGFLGEISPQVLTHWKCRMPAAALELALDRLHEIVSGAA